MIMSSFGVGVYFLTVIWFISLMLCWVSVRTNHHIGRVAIGGSVVITVILVALPKGDGAYSRANFYDKVFVIRYAILSVLLICLLFGAAYSFIHYCLTPVETRKVRSIGTIHWICFGKLIICRQWVVCFVYLVV